MIRMLLGTHDELVAPPSGMFCTNDGIVCGTPSNTHIHTIYIYIIREFYYVLNKTCIL